MLGTYVSLALILGASFVVGQATFSVCGSRERSALAPAVGLALLCAVAWGAAHLASSAWAGLGACAALTVTSGTLLRFEPARGAVEGRATTIAGAVILGSIPFVVEMRFGILGTSLNPDMSQHLLAADRIVSGGTERLVTEGYPLGPHALVASVSELGPSLVHAFDGLMLAVGVAASVAPLALLKGLDKNRRIGAALLVGMAYLAASYLIQGAFKETMQALFVLAFATGLAQLTSGELGGAQPADRWGRLQAVPLAALAIGSLYAYSFPGLTWMAGALGLWALAEIFRSRGVYVVRWALVPALVALLVVALAAAPEIPRMLDFGSFETFNPDGAGLGNLFNPVSPLEALGIWPSGDFRLDPGAGFAPTPAFYLGGAVALVALLVGIVKAVRAGETALAAAVVAGGVLYAYALVSGTPYQEAKALTVVAPLAALVAVRAGFESLPPVSALRAASLRALAGPALTLLFVAGAAGSSALALANGPVGPSSWTPALQDFSAEAGDEPMLVVIDDDLIDQNGFDLVVWELRGRDVCALAQSEVNAQTVSGRAFGTVVVIGELEGPLPVVGRLDEVARDGDYVLYDAKLAGDEPDCPFIADGDRAEPGS